jgi:two-component system, OmpR family, phosphate regulon sensor histidine kinase PhoR
MENFRVFSLLLNGLTLSLALAFLIIVLWFYNKKPLLQSFSLFLMSVTFWHSAALLAEVVQLIEPRVEMSTLFSLIGDIGFASSSITLYIFVSSLIVTHTRGFRILALSSLILIILNNLVIVQNIFRDDISQSIVNAPVVGVSILYFLLFDVVCLYLILLYRRKIRSLGLLIGLSMFILGQGLTFLNPELGITSFALLVSAFATVIMSFSIIQLELIQPLDERISQVETIQQISLSIMQRNRIDLVIDEASQAVVSWLGANATVVYLIDGGQFKMAASFQIPDEMVIVAENSGVARETFNQQKALLYENYSRDWHGEEDFNLANETVGSVMSVPLFSNAEILGVLLVIASQKGKVFDNHDLRLLEQLSNQVAVAISHSQLYENLENAHAQLQTVLTSTDNPVIAVNKELKIIFINPSAKLLFAQEIEEKTDSIISGSIPIPRRFLPENLKDFMYQIRNKGYFTHEYDFGNHIYLCRIASLGMTDIDGWVAVLNDITNLMELDRMKNEMIRMTSHDLKNPLQAALANLDLLREDIDIGNEEAVLSLNLIEKQLDKMSRIIGGILDLERLKMGYQVYNQSVDIHNLLEQVVEEIEDYAQDNNISIIEDFQSLHNKNLNGDFHQLKRVFVNLMENAIKFTPENGTVWLIGDILKTKIVISVKDNGVGISNDLQGRIFERFFRGQQDEYQHVSGSGLGLSFVKSIVENHQGLITIESEPNQGSCFQLIFDWIE